MNANAELGAIITRAIELIPDGETLDEIKASNGCRSNQGSEPEPGRMKVRVKTMSHDPKYLPQSTIVRHYELLFCKGGDLRLVSETHLG